MGSALKVCLNYMYYIAFLFLVSFIEVGTLRVDNQLSLKTIFSKCVKKALIRILMSISYQHCAAECRRRPACESINYSPRGHWCQLNSADRPVEDCTGVIFVKKDAALRTDTGHCNSTCLRGQSCLLREDGSVGCTYSECLLPVTPERYFVVGNMNAIGNRVVLRCSMGFEMMGSPQVSTCQQNGSWSGTTPCCLKKPVVYNTCWLSAEYLGCYRDAESERDISGELTWYTDTLTLEICASSCRGKDWAYFGVQFRQQCFCGNEYGRYGVAPEEDCFYSCIGNTSQVCGGDWRNSVYKLL